MIGQISKYPVSKPCSTLACIGLGALLCLPFMGVAQADTKALSKSVLKSHRVLYDMNLGRAEQGTNITNATGTMFYRFEALCEGWEVESRVFMRIGYNADDETRNIETTWSFGSFESYDGEQFTFDVDHNQDGMTQEDFAGEAGIADGIGSAQFDDHDETSVDLPEGTMFPARHLILLLEKAKAGQTLVTKKIFDGASRHNPYLVNAYILGPVVDGELLRQTPEKMATNRHVPLLKDNSASVHAAMRTKDATPDLWRIRLGYFPVLSEEEFPEFEIEVDYDARGIAQRMVQDFGDFTLNLTPRNFETLAPADCQ